MRQLRPGSKRTIREINRALVLGLIRRHGALSRVRLAKLASLSQPTVGEVVAELLAAGLVRETAAVVSGRRGPRPVLLELNRAGGFAPGVMIRPDSMSLVIADLLGDVVARAQRPLPRGAPPDRVLALVAEAVRQELAAAGVAWERVLGLGVSITGEIDSASGMCWRAHILGWREVPVGPALQAALDLPVYVDNDTRTLTVAERSFGLGRHEQDFVLVTVGRGVGMGAVVSGELLRGHQNVGGEFGHVTMQLGGPPCPCGKRGCLEAIASDVGLVRAAAELGLAAPDADIHELTARAQAGDPALRELFEHAGVALGVGIANLITLFGPALVVLTGEGLRAGELLLGPLRRTLPGCVFGDMLARTRLVVKPWDPSWEPWARGAACLVLEDMLRPELYQPARDELALHHGARERDRPGESTALP